jgi:hypothetical protein
MEDGGMCTRMALEIGGYAKQYMVQILRIVYNTWWEHWRNKKMHEVGEDNSQRSIIAPSNFIMKEIVPSIKL